MKTYTVLRFIQRKQKLTRSVWVKTIAWGEGSKVKSVTFTANLAEAARLSQVTALTVAEQFFTSQIVLESQDGVPNVALTAQLVKEQMTKLQNRNEIVRKANAEMRAFWTEIEAAVPGLRAWMQELQQFGRTR